MNSVKNVKMAAIGAASLALSFNALAMQANEEQPMAQEKPGLEQNQANTERAKEIFQAEQAKEPERPPKPQAVDLPKEPSPEELKALKMKEKEAATLKKRTYKISFEKKSQKNPKIEEVTIKGQIYKNRNPFKRFEMKTNAAGELIFDKYYGDNLAVSLYYIEGEEKAKVRCQGYAPIGQFEVKVNCR